MHRLHSPYPAYLQSLDEAVSDRLICTPILYVIHFEQ